MHYLMGPVLAHDIAQHKTPLQIGGASRHGRADTFCLRSDALLADLSFSLDIDASAFLRSLFSFCFARCFRCVSILASYSVLTLRAQCPPPLRNGRRRIRAGLYACTQQSGQPEPPGQHSLSLVHVVEAPGAGCQLLVFVLAQPPHDHAQAVLPVENNLRHLNVVPLVHQRVQDVAGFLEIW